MSLAPTIAKNVLKGTALERAKKLGFMTDDVLTHASPEGHLKRIGSASEQPNRIFDGIFASKHGAVVPGVENRLIVRRIAREGDIDLDYKSAIKTIKREFPDAKDDEIDLIYDLSAGDENIFNIGSNPLAKYGYDDLGEASWEMQNLRGKIALDQGFDAIAVSDEFGTSYFIPHGATVRSLEARFDPSKISSRDLFASSIPITGAAALLTSEAAEASSFDLSTARPVASLKPSGFDLATARPVDQEKKVGGQAGRGARLRRERSRVTDLLTQAEQGQITSSDLSQSDLEKVQKARIEEIPELTGSFKQLSENLKFTDALVGMTAFDPDEFGRILSNADPDIGVVTTPEGELIAVNNRTGGAMSINKLGPSMMDAIQLGGAAAMFTPAGRLPTITGQALGAATTQAGIEIAQQAKGGEFDPENVAITGTAVPAVAGILRYGKGAIDNFKRLVRSKVNLIDEATGLPVPAFQKALDKRNIDFGALIDDIENLPVIRSGGTPDQVVHRIVKGQIEQGAKKDYLHAIRLSNGKIVKDDLGIAAMKQGFKEGEVSVAKHANQATRKKMQKMLRMQRAILADRSKDFRPSDVAGEAVLTRFNFVRTKAERLRNELNKIASKELTVKGKRLLEHGGPSRLKGLEINPSRIEKRFFTELEKLNATVDLGVFPPRIDFTGSMISKDRTSQRIIRNVTDLLSEPGPVDALRAHNLKRQLDSLIDFQKKSAQGLTESGRSFAKAIRAELNESIREVSLKYARVNDDLSSAIKAMQDFEKALGGSIDVFAPGASKAIGQDLRGLLSQRKTRIKLDNALNQLDNTATDLGANFDVNYKDLNIFTNTLENRFGSPATTSFRGSIDAAKELEQIRRGDLGDIALRKGLEKMQEMRGINDRAAMDAMQKLLVRGK